MPRMDFLDYLRGIAILLVLLAHTHNFIFSLPNYGNVFARGVQLFYLVSGYTIFMIYLNKIHTINDFLIFMMRRAFRILPLFYFLIPIYYYIFGTNNNLSLHNHFSDSFHIISHYLLFFGFFKETVASIISPAWSIAVELVFYISFAIIPFFLKQNIKLHHTIYIFSTLFIISIVTSLYSWMFLDSNMAQKTFLFFSPLFNLWIFYLGGLCFLLKEKIKVNNTILIISLIFLFLYPFFVHNSAPSVFISVCLFSVILLFYSSHSSKNSIQIMPFKNIIIFIGKISFSIYLIHIYIIQIYTNIFTITTILDLLIIYLIIIFMSFISYSYIEKPFILIGKKIFKNSNGRSHSI